MQVDYYKLILISQLYKLVALGQFLWVGHYKSITVGWLLWNSGFMSINIDGCFN